MTIYSMRQNAARAARKAIADGSAAAPTYEIRPATGGGFRIAWDVAEPTPGELPPEDEKSVERLAASPDAPAPVKAGTQLEKVLDLLKRPDGATIAEIQAVTGWLPHTTRAFISVQVRRKAGLEVTTDKVEGRGRVYRVAA